MVEGTGKFQLVNGDDDNFDKIMVAIGESHFAASHLNGSMINIDCFMQQVFRLSSVNLAANPSLSSSSSKKAITSSASTRFPVFPNASR